LVAIDVMRQWRNIQQAVAALAATAIDYPPMQAPASFNLVCQPVEVWRFTRHDSLVIGANVEPPDVVAHDNKNVGLSRRWLSLCLRGQVWRGCHQTCRRSECRTPQEHVTATHILADAPVSHGFPSG